MAGMAGWYDCSLPVTLLAIQQSTWPEGERGWLPEENWGSHTRRSGRRSPQHLWPVPGKWPCIFPCPYLTRETHPAENVRMFCYES